MLESTCRAFFDLQGVQLRPAPDAVMTTHCARVVESAPAQNRSEAVEGQIDVPAANRDANPRVGFISYSRRPAPRDAVLSGPTSRAATADERDRSGDRQHRFADRVRMPQEREARTETDLASVADEGEEGVEDPQLPSQVEQAEEHWRKVADEKRMVEAEAKSRRAEEMQRRSDGGTDPTVSFPGTGDIRDAWERGARAAARAHVGEAGEELASNVRQHIEEDRGYVKVRLPSLKRKAAEEARRGDVDVPENSGEAKKKEESNAGAKAHKMVEVEAHQNAEDAAHRFVDAEAVLTAEDGAPKEAESAAQQKVGAEAVKGAEAVARKEAGAAAELTSEAVELMVVEAVAQKESEAMASQKDEAAAQQNDEADAHKESAAAAQQKDEGAAPRMVEAEAQKESEAAAQQKEEGAAPKMVEAEAQKASEAAALQKEEGAAPKMVEAEAQKASEAAALQKEEGAAPKMVEAEAQKASEAAALQKEEGAASNMVEAEAQKESEAAAREKDKAAALHMEEADAHKEGEARNKAEAAARQKAEAEEQKQAAEEALQLARAEARKKAVVEAQKKAEGVAQKMSEAEEQKQAEADARRKPDGEDGSDGNKMVQTEGRETAGAEGHIIAEEEGQHNEEAASQVFAYRETQSMAETGRQNTMEEVRVVPEAGVGHYEGDALETEEEQNEEDTVHPAVRIFLGGSPTRGPGTGVEGPWRVADDGAPRDTVGLNRQRRPTLHQRAVERNLGQGGVAEAFWQVEWVEAETAIRRMLHRTSTVLVEQGDRFVEAESWDISPAEVTRRLTLLARMVTQTFCNLAARNSSISRDVADLTVHYCRDALANLEEVRHGNEERRRQAETAARFREEVDTRLSNLQESIVRVSDQVRQSGGGMAEGTLKGVEERLREVLREESERRNRDRLQDEERRQKAMRKEADAAERRKKEQQQEEARRQKEMREGMKEMKEAMMKEMKAEMKEMKDGMVNQIVGRLSAVLREESERQKKERQVDAERRQQQDAKRKQVADDEERRKRIQLDEQWRKEEEVKRKDVEATERRRKNKHQEEERRQKEVEAGMKEVMEAVKEMKTGITGWKEGMLSEVEKRLSMVLRLDAERRQKEEQGRKATEGDRRQKEDAQRKEAEEAERVEREKQQEMALLQKEEAQRKDAEEAERQEREKQQEMARLQEEDRQRKEAEEVERRQRAKQQELERLQKEETQKKEAEEAERQQRAKQQEMERLQKEEAQKKEVEEAERQQRAKQQEMERLQKEEAQKKEAEEAERQQRAKQQEMERLQKEEAQKKEAEEAERQQRAKQQEMERLQKEEAQKEAEEAERQQRAKQQEMERLQKEEAQKKEAEEAERQQRAKQQEMERLQKAEQCRAEKRARLASYAEQQRQLEAKAKAMAEETERLAREMEEEDLTMQGEGTWTGVEEDLTMQGEGTWTGVEEEIVEGLGTLLLIESGEANVAEGVPSVPVRNVEVSRRRPRQEDREPEGHAAKRRRAAGIQELIPIIQGEKKGMKIDKCDNRKNAVVDDKGKTLGVCLPFRGSGFSQRGEGALQKWTSEQTVGGRKRNLGSHKTVWERAYTVAVCWKFYFPDIDMQAYGMNPNRINKWREDLDFTTWLPTGVWSVINELHLDKPDGFSLVQTNTALRQQQGDGFQVAACAGVGITAWQKMVGGVEGENGYSTEEHAIGLAATLSVMWAASTNVDQTQWETGATTAARGTSTAIASSAARSSTAATASSDASSSSAADVPSAVHNALATLAASVACVAVEAMRSVKDQEHDKEAWILPLSDALLKALPAESRAAEDAKRMTRVVAKVVTSWCLCSMASRGLRQHQGVWLGVLQKKLGGRDTTTGADKEKKTKKSSAKGNATKDASTEENTGTGGQD
ncbi:unnamed protein product [Closterium sp. NIES-65]|nr:unnamed protein product [Closterium sp. NIES-65]